MGDSDPASPTLFTLYSVLRFKCMLRKSVAQACTSGRSPSTTSGQRIPTTNPCDQFIKNLPQIIREIYSVVRGVQRVKDFTLTYPCVFSAIMDVPCMSAHRSMQLQYSDWISKCIRLDPYYVKCLVVL